MSPRSFFHPSQPHRKVRRADHGHTTRRPRFETLEDRHLLSFTPAGNYATVGTPSFIVAADFNNDGKLDLATCANAGTGSVSVLLGNGAGGFGAVQRTVFGSGLRSLAVADFNNDTRPDLLVSDLYNGASALIGNGDGTFEPAVPLNLIGGAGKDVVALGRSSHGSTEILVTWLGPDWQTHVQVYAGNLQGGFTGGQYAHYWGNGGMAPVDLNNDGHLDVATGDGVVFLGDFNQSLYFDESQPYPLTGGAVATGDFTGDGNADVIVAGSSVAVLRGRGDARLDAPIHHSANGTVHSAVTTADFNADGKLDAVVTDADLGTVSVMLGNGDGTLRYATAFATGTSPSGVVVGDFNRDGRPDVAVANAGYESRHVSILLNDGNWNVFPPPPVVPTLSVSDATITEGNTGTTSATFTITLSEPTSTEVSVYYNTANITAVAGSDFDYTSGIVFIPAGQTTKTVTVAVKGDHLPEPTETFAVNLLLPTNAKIADGQGIGTIIDNDQAPTISINNVSKSEGNSKTSFSFTVSLSAAYDQAVTVNYATANGSAKAGSDYTSKSGTLTFAPGETTKTISVTINGDKSKETNETFFVNLSGAIGGGITNSQGLGTILNDDSGGSKGKVSSSVLAFDAAIEDWMFSGRKKRAR